MRCAVCGGENPNLKTPSGQEVVCGGPCGRVDVVVCLSEHGLSLQPPCRAVEDCVVGN